MQAVHIRRYTLAGTIIAAVLVTLLLVATLVMVSFESEGTGAMDVSLSAPAVPQFDQIHFLEANTQQLPYSVPLPPSHTEITFWEANTQQIPYNDPAPVYTGTLMAE